MLSLNEIIECVHWRHLPKLNTAKIINILFAVIGIISANEAIWRFWNEGWLGNETHIHFFYMYGPLFCLVWIGCSLSLTTGQLLSFFEKPTGRMYTVLAVFLVLWMVL